MQTSPKLKLFDKLTADIWCVSSGALSIVVFLSLAFVSFDATNLPPSHSTIGVGQHGVIDRGVINQGVIQNDEGDQGASDRDKDNRSEPSEDLIAAASTELPKTPFQLVHNTSASFSYQTVATLAPDNTMWRYTSEGWHDISMMTDPPPANAPPLQKVHPAVWTALLLLSSLLLLIMASSDEEIRNLFGQSNNQKKNL